MELSLMRSRILSPLIGFPLLAILPAVVLPCIWDSDTLADEVRGLPDAQDLVIGRWFRHGKGYYKKRIEAIPELLNKHPREFGLYDDLAVAYERIRDRDAAIAVMRRKQAALLVQSDSMDVLRDSWYRYHANLGTFLAHKGEFDKALVELAKAIEINPKAHFGRERFQTDLIRYVAACKKDRTLWSRHNYFTYAERQPKENSWYSITGTMSFTTRYRADANTRKSPWKDMYTATAGMLRFGGLEGAELYRSLGDLFLARQDLNLAWWAWQVAITKGHPAEARLRQACKSIEKHWKEAARNTRKRFRAPTLALFQSVQKNSRKWLQSFQDIEQELLDAGKDPSQKKVLTEILVRTDRAVPRILPLPRRQGPSKRAVRDSAKAQGAPGRDRESGPPPAGGKLEKKSKGR